MGFTAYLLASQRNFNWFGEEEYGGDAGVSQESVSQESGGRAGFAAAARTAQVVHSGAVAKD